jgi:outer membrane lipoprotein-sorting protein
VGQFAAGLILAAGFAAAQAQGPPDPWTALQEVRGKLAGGGPREARFEQVFLPAGFSQGERETGRLALSLPDCLRWDYDEPYPKSFLVCGDLAWAWNPEDGTGKRQQIDGRNEPGLDLLLLGVADLASRYLATAQAAGDRKLSVELSPKGGETQSGTVAVRRATLLLDLEAGVVAGLAYVDQEGNETRFTLDGYAPLAAAERFVPPAEVAWEEADGPP